MANTPAVGSTNKASSYEEYQKNQRIAKNQLGKNDFLNLLVAQMKYQDPLEPTKDSDFVAQLAQFSSLEQMQAMSASMTMMQAYDLVGKYVIAPDVKFEDGTVQTLEGVVNSIVYKDGEYFAQIGEAFVKVSKISEVLDTDYIAPENKLTDSAHLLGCTVKGYIVDEKGDAIYDKSKPVLNAKGEPVYDTTKPIKDENGQPKLGADGKPLYEPLYEVKSVEGTVTSLGIKNGEVVAYVETADGSEAIVPVKLIFDIRRAAAAPQTDAETKIPVGDNGSTIIIPPATNTDKPGDNTGNNSGTENPVGDKGSVIITPKTEADEPKDTDDPKDQGEPKDQDDSGLVTGNGGGQPQGSGSGIIITN